MQTANTKLFDRGDTFFGVCEGLGQDLGISPTWFRVAFPVAAYFNPVAAVAVYAALGVLVYTLRWLVPDRPKAAAAEAAQPALIAAENDAAPAPVSIAA